MEFWFLLLHFGVAAVIVGGMLAVSHVLGERTRGHDTERRYESGMPTTGSTRGRLPVPFHQVAIAFLIFDLEVVFLVGWALVAREAGWTAFAGILVFALMLLVGLVYELRTGAFDWIRWSIAPGDGRGDPRKEARP